MTATGPFGPPPRRSSSAVNVRPSIGVHAQRVEVVAARVDAVDEIGPPTLREIEAGRPPRERERRLEQIGMAIADLLPHRIRPRRARVHRRVRQEQHEPVGPFDRKRTQQQAVDDGEHGGVGADAERERQDDDGGDDGRRSQRRGSRYGDRSRDSSQPWCVSVGVGFGRVVLPSPTPAATTRTARRARRPDRFSTDAPARQDSFDNIQSRSKSGARPPGAVRAPQSRP